MINTATFKSHTQYCQKTVAEFRRGNLVMLLPQHDIRVKPQRHKSLPNPPHTYRKPSEHSPVQVHPQNSISNNYFPTFPAPFIAISTRVNHSQKHHQLTPHNIEDHHPL